MTDEPNARATKACPSTTRTPFAIRRARVLSVFRAISVFKELSPTMCVGEVLMFLAVALNEGASQVELAEIAHCRRTAASRYLLDLSVKTRVGGEGHGLVQAELDHKELRRKLYTLTSKGRQILSIISSEELD